MKVPVPAATKHGTTGATARAIAEVLTERGLDVTVLPARDAGAIHGYDAVVLGSAVYAGHWLKPAGSWSTAPAPPSP